MPSSLSKLWFHQSGNDFPINLHGGIRYSPRSSGTVIQHDSVDSNSTSDTRSLFHSTSSSNSINDLRFDNRYPAVHACVDRDNDNDDEDYREHQRHVTRGERSSGSVVAKPNKKAEYNKRSNSAPTAPTRKKSFPLHNTFDTSSFAKQDNWILKKPDDVDSEAHVSQTSPRRYCNEIFPAVGEDVNPVDLELDLSWSDPPSPEPNNCSDNNSKSDMCNGIHRDNDSIQNGTKTGVIRPPNPAGQFHDRVFPKKKGSRELNEHNGLYNLIHDRSRAAVISSPSPARQLNIQVSPKKPLRGKQLKVSDDRNRYTIQPVSPALTIESVTMHKPKIS